MIKFFLIGILLLLSCQSTSVLKGKVRVVGNAPFLKVVLTTDSLDYTLANKYKPYQGSFVKCVGKISVTEISMGNGVMKHYSIDPDSIIVIKKNGLFYNE